MCFLWLCSFSGLLMHLLHPGSTCPGGVTLAPGEVRQATGPPEEPHLLFKPVLSLVLECVGSSSALILPGHGSLCWTSDMPFAPGSVWGQPSVLCSGAGRPGCLGEGAAAGSRCPCGQLPDGASQAAKSQTSHHRGHQVRLGAAVTTR